MSHTPGPWTAEAGTKVMDPNGHRLADIHGRGEADARLIAAAPDLLDAAATLLGELDRWEVPQENEAGEFEAVERLRRAIDKATGVRV